MGASTVVRIGLCEAHEQTLSTDSPGDANVVVVVVDPGLVDVSLGTNAVGTLCVEVLRIE